LEAWNGARISVGAPFYNATFAPMMGIMVVIMAVAPLMAWRIADGRQVIIRMFPALGLVALTMVLSILIIDDFSMTAAATLGLAFWLIGGVMTDLIMTAGFHRQDRALAWQRLVGIPLSRWGMNLAHLGTAVFILGAAGASFFESETIKRAFPGDVLTAGDKTYRLESVMPIEGPNYSSTAATISLLDEQGAVIDTIISEIRFYPVSGTTTTEAAIRPRLSGDAYAVLGDGDAERGYTLRLYDKPLVSWIWGGASLMALGGLLAMARGRKEKTS